MISGYISNFTDAYFETMSGFTTTGATILDDVECFPHGLLFWR
jgi:trk system potassium uptake protein